MYTMETKENFRNTLNIIQSEIQSKDEKGGFESHYEFFCLQIELCKAKILEQYLYEIKEKINSTIL